MQTKILIFAILALFLFSCKKDKMPAASNEVWMNNMQFSPSSITISAGTTIKWTNKESVTHTVTSDNSLFDSGDMGNESTFSYTFSNAGTYPYHCKYHADMKASVIVH
jgi:plastocyanin